ncbi:LacI family DNA-binding transcriptional regulator [Cellulomonas sp. PhB143]|uniref:LacI family DNA-binding transcriptional regulator n=1 Tax=Cellulomonas sp. PhB143 TaxID=2485186 RepID=UPI000F4811F2|nr:LacI family DNA-binding transcriptional regulator [Cellulomonas sp. PhB143]ROS79142.1 LacI family transcriptional regulator [Cellulomonas sp. PhB143]
MARPTIVDIAQAAGVSKGAVSFALNNRPGVSDATRSRILAVATELGWVPNAAARSLAGTKAGAIGMVFARPAKTLAVEPFFMQLIAGIESELARESLALVFQVVEDHEAEIATYRRWAAERRVDGVLVVDPYADDDRLAPLRELDLHAVFIGIPPTSEGFAGVWSDMSRSMDAALTHLLGLGHTRIARVAGDERHDHVVLRDADFTRWTTERGLDECTIKKTDYSVDSGSRATFELLSSDRPPTAIIYDNDVMALAAVGVAHELGVDIPGRVSLLAWDDSILCSLSHPAITALHRDLTEFGAAAASLLLELVAGAPRRRVETPSGTLVVRGSTGPAPSYEEKREA